MLLHNPVRYLLIGFIIFCSISATADVTQKTLDNGLKIIIKEDHRFPIAYVTFSYQVGSTDEPSHQSGISHFLEHMMYGRTDNLSHTNMEDFHNIHSGHHNAMTTYEHTQYTTAVTPEEVSAVLNFEKDRMTELQFVDADVQKERQVILQERNQYITHSPWSESKEMFHALSFPTGVYHHPIIGWEEDIKIIKTDQLRAWYEYWYQPKNLTIVVIGDINTEQVTSNIERLFNDLPSTSVNRTHILENKKREGDIRIDLKKDVKNPLFVVGFQIPKPDNASLKTEIIFSLLEDLLTSRQQGIVYQELIDNTHLAVEIDTEVDYLKKINGYFSFYIIPNKNIHFYSIKNKLLNSLSKVDEADITDERLYEIKKHYLARYVFLQDSLSNQSKLYSKLISLNLDPNRYGQIKEALGQISKKDIVNTLQYYFNEDSPKVILTVKPL